MKLSILFLLRKNKINNKGTCPIECRLTFNNKRKPFSTGLFVNPKYWDNKQQKVKPPNEDCDFINTQLSLIKSKINQAFLFLQVQGNDFDIEDIFKKYKGENTQKQIGVVEFYSEHMDRLKKMIGEDFKESTWGKFNEILPALKDYIYFQYKKRDIKLVDLDYNFIENFDYYMKVEKKNSQITINKKIQRLKKVVKSPILKTAVENGTLSQVMKDQNLHIPSVGYKLPNTEILVLEVKERPTGVMWHGEVLEKYWENWFIDMGAKKNIIRSQDININETKKFIKNDFFNVKN